MPTSGSLPSNPQKERIASTLALPRGSTPGTYASERTVERHILWANVESERIALGSEYGSTGYLLTREDIERNGAEAIQKLTYTLPQAEADAENPAEVPEDTYVEDCGTEQVDIRQHPRFDSDMRTAWEWSEELEKFTLAGKEHITSYLAPNSIVTHTEYFTSKPSLDLTGLGKRGEAPGGEAEYGSEDNWLLVNVSRGKSGNFYTVVKQYQYSQEVWEETIYAPA